MPFDWLPSQALAGGPNIFYDIVRYGFRMPQFGINLGLGTDR